VTPFFKKKQEKQNKNQHWRKEKTNVSHKKRKGRTYAG
jgi:hypothetical protein